MISERSVPHTGAFRPAISFSAGFSPSLIPGKSSFHPAFSIPDQPPAGLFVQQSGGKRMTAHILVLVEETQKVKT